jgi:hypothetical protein
MKKNKKPLPETGMMISSPWNPNRELSFVDIIVRELEKLSDEGIISPVEYSKGIDMARGQAKVLNAIYSKNANGIQQAILFLLRQVRSR